MSKEALRQEFRRMHENHPEMNHPVFRHMMQVWLKNRPGKEVTIQEMFDAVHPKWVELADAWNNHEGGEK